MAQDVGSQNIKRHGIGLVIQELSGRSEKKGKSMFIDFVDVVGTLKPCSILALRRCGMEITPALLAPCEGKPPISGEFPTQRAAVQNIVKKTKF